jgi:hypothetical protein
MAAGGLQQQQPNIVGMNVQQQNVRSMIQTQQPGPPQSQPQQIQQPKTPQQQQQQQQPNTPQHVASSSTPPIIVTVNPQQQQQQQSFISAPLLTQQVQQQLMQQPQQSFSLNQPKSQIWEGFIEWTEKDRNNPNNTMKQMHSAKALMLSFSVLDQASGQYHTEVAAEIAQSWPQRISIQLLSKQILDILAQQCPPPIKQLQLVTENNSQDLRTALSIGVIIEF